jgi:hypothetical protein
MKKLFLISSLFTTTTFAGLPVTDGAIHSTDLLDNIIEIIDFTSALANQAEQISNQIEELEKLETQIEQMDDQLLRFGKASSTSFKTDHLGTNDLENILDEIDDYKYGTGLTGAEQQENKKLYGDIDKDEHVRIDDPDPDKKYEKHERVEKEYAAYKKTSESISIKRLELLDEISILSKQLSSASTAQEQDKLKGAIAANKVVLQGLKDEEERQYRSYQAELERNRNMREKEETRYRERFNKNDRDFKDGFKPFKRPNLLEDLTPPNNN